MIKEIKDFKREKLFEHYNSCTNPFSFITTEVEVTNIVEYCKIHRNYYATFGYIITQTANEIDNFKYRYKDGKFYYCDKIKSNYTQMYKDETIGYFSLPPINDYKEYIKTFLVEQERFLEKDNYEAVYDIDEIWLSCEPWFTFTGLVTPYNKNEIIPQFIWDKYKYRDGKYYINLMIGIHHGFADGIHIAKFLELLNQNIKNFNN